MARKTATFTGVNGRDKGKRFLLTEMPASQAEKWALRAILAMGRSQAIIPEGFESAGMQGIGAIVATLGFRAVFGLSFLDAEPLMDEMMACVEICPDPANPQVQRRLVEDDIEEVQTRFQIRDEVVALHVGFSLAAKYREFRNRRAEASSNTSTSPPSSEPSSAAD